MENTEKKDKYGKGPRKRKERSALVQVGGEGFAWPSLKGAQVADRLNCRMDGLLHLYIQGKEYFRNCTL